MDGTHTIPPPPSPVATPPQSSASAASPHASAPPSSPSVPSASITNDDSAAPDAPPPTLSPTLFIDHLRFPHIVDLIVSFASHNTLLAFRRTSREFHKRVDRLVPLHVCVWDKTFPPARPGQFATIALEKHWHGVLDTGCAIDGQGYERQYRLRVPEPVDMDGFAGPVRDPPVENYSNNNRTSAHRGLLERYSSEGDIFVNCVYMSSGSGEGSTGETRPKGVVLREVPGLDGSAIPVDSEPPIVDGDDDDDEDDDDRVAREPLGDAPPLPARTVAALRHTRAIDIHGGAHLHPDMLAALGKVHTVRFISRLDTYVKYFPPQLLPKRVVFKGGYQVRVLPSCVEKVVYIAKRHDRLPYIHLEQHVQGQEDGPQRHVVIVFPNHDMSTLVSDAAGALTRVPNWALQHVWEIGRVTYTFVYPHTNSLFTLKELRDRLLHYVFTSWYRHSDGTWDEIKSDIDKAITLLTLDQYRATLDDADFELECL